MFWSHWGQGPVHLLSLFRSNPERPSSQHEGLPAKRGQAEETLPGAEAAVSAPSLPAKGGKMEKKKGDREKIAHRTGNEEGRFKSWQGSLKASRGMEATQVLVSGFPPHTMNQSGHNGMMSCASHSSTAPALKPTFLPPRCSLLCFPLPGSTGSLLPGKCTEPVGKPFRPAHRYYNDGCMRERSTVVSLSNLYPCS